MGSLCCVAARPHGSSATSWDPSVSSHELYWLTNTSFSPPPSTWDFHFQSEALSQSRECINPLRGNNLVSDGIGPSFSSPSDISPAQQWNPLALQETSNDDYGTLGRDEVSKPLSLSPTMEVTSASQYSRGSTPSESESCDYEYIANSHSFTSNSKPVHTFSFPTEFDARNSTNESINMTEIPLPLEYHLLTKSRNTLNSQSLKQGSSDCSKCGLCERLLSQKSPINFRCDKPVTGVLSCHHVFHAECLEQITPKGRGNDPPCPVCAKIEENSQEVRVFSKLSKLTRVKSLHEDGPSKTWGCARAGDCVGGALWSPTRNKLMPSNMSRVRRNLLVKGSPGRESSGKLRKSGSFSSRLFVRSAEHGDVGSSKTMRGSYLK